MTAVAPSAEVRKKMNDVRRKKMDDLETKLAVREIVGSDLRFCPLGEAAVDPGDIAVREFWRSQECDHGYGVGINGGYTIVDDPHELDENLPEAIPVPGDLKVAMSDDPPIPSSPPRTPDEFFRMVAGIEEWSFVRRLEELYDRVVLSSSVNKRHYIALWDKALERLSQLTGSFVDPMLDRLAAIELTPA